MIAVWNAIVDGVKRYSQLGFFQELFEFQLQVHERCAELLLGERQPLEDGVLMVLLAYLTKTSREIYPIIQRLGPEGIRPSLRGISKATADDMLELLAVYYLDDRIPKAALQHVPNEAICRWYARMFLQPAAPLMLERTVGAEPDFRATPFRCPKCRHKPQLVFSDGSLQCSLCFFSWVPPPGICPQCRSNSWQGAEISSDLPHVKLISCSACQSYLKQIHSVEGSIPYVDELASAGLDDRARARGWRKIEGNLLLQ